ncbi:MAG: hypothetical protein ABL956_02335 [Hyphomonadaceae bacterium]
MRRGFGAFEYRRAKTEGDYSATTTVAGLIVVTLGVYAPVGSQSVAASGGVATVVMLAFKQVLHDWLRSITCKEVRSATLIPAATFIALPGCRKGQSIPGASSNRRRSGS